MEDFVRKTRGVRDINSLPLSSNHELDMVADVKGKIYIKILNRYKELLFDNGTEQWVIDMLNKLEVDVEQLKEDILDIEQTLSELPMIEDKLKAVESKLDQINALFTQLQTDLGGLDLRTAELEREVIQLAKAAETVDTRLTTTIATSDTMNTLQNSRLTALESKVVDTAWQNLTPINPFTAPKGIQVKRQNGIVYLRGSLSDGTGDCFTLPVGFRPPSGYEYHYLLPGQSTVQSDVAKIYVRHTGLCSIVSKSGTTPVFLEPIMFSIT